MSGRLMTVMKGIYSLNPACPRKNDALSHTVSVKLITAPRRGIQQLIEIRIDEFRFDVKETYLSDTLPWWAERQKATGCPLPGVIACTRSSHGKARLPRPVRC
jgi:hypothetical protein